MSGGRLEGAGGTSVRDAVGYRVEGKRGLAEWGASNRMSLVPRLFSKCTRGSAQDWLSGTPRNHQVLPRSPVQRQLIVGVGTGGQQSCSRPGLQANGVTAPEVRAG